MNRWAGAVAYAFSRSWAALRGRPAPKRADPRLVVSAARAHRERAAAAKQIEAAAAERDRLRVESDGLRRAVDRYAEAYRRVLAGLEGLEGRTPGPGSGTPSPPQVQADEQRAREVFGQAAFVDQLARGASPEEAVADLARRFLLDHRVTPQKRFSIQAVCLALLDDDATKVAGSLGAAMVAHSKGVPQLGWEHFKGVPAAVWRRLAPAEYFRTGFEVDPAATEAAARELLDRLPDDVSPAGWMALIREAFRADHLPLADEAHIAASKMADAAPGAWALQRAELRWLGPWLDKALGRVPPPAVPHGHVAFGVIGYKQPDLWTTSTNIGDYIQTVASLGHLARHRHVRFHGPDGLGAFVSELQGRGDEPLDTAANDVTLVPLNRDASTLEPVPDPTWLIGFGWFLHAPFGMRLGNERRKSGGRICFPLHPSIRPIFISFHCARPQMLSPEGIEYLKRYEPIGCRDWTTVHLLQSVGVSAFFSGCVTTTVDVVFPTLTEAERPRTDRRAYVDVPVPADAPEGSAAITQNRDDVRWTDLASNLARGTELLERYRREFSAVVTSKLHCYLPARSLGVPVEFTPTTRTDVRFNGLVDLEDKQFEEMRRGVLDKLEAVISAIVSGASEGAVYGVWREICAADVTEAQRRRASVPAIRAPSFDVAEACATVRDESVVVPRTAAAASGPEVHVALALDGNLKAQMDVVIEAMSANCSRPLHLWILSRDHGPEDHARLAALFASVSFTWLPCDHVDYGPIKDLIPYTTISTMDRLLLPDLLHELDRVVYLDIDTLALGDVATLYDWDLGGRPLAARTPAAAPDGYGLLLRSARALGEKEANDLLWRMYAKHPYGFRAFNAGVLVLDLARMRTDDFVRQYVPFVERYGLHDQSVLNCYAGGDRAELPPEWNFVPQRDVPISPKIIHWVGNLKPWGPYRAALGEHWSDYEDRVRTRASAPGFAEDAEPSEVAREVVRRRLTFLSEAKLANLEQCVARIDREGIPGTIVEVGVARGGSAVVLAAAGAQREFHGYDVFGMIPPPTERDGEDVHRRYEVIAQGKAGGRGDDLYYGYRDDLRAEVEATMRSFGLDLDTAVLLHEGLIEDTLHPAGPIALVHIDCDWYDPVRLALERTYPLVSPGGYVICDDYFTWSGARRAVDEFVPNTDLVTVVERRHLILRRPKGPSDRTGPS